MKNLIIFALVAAIFGATAVKAEELTQSNSEEIFGIGSSTGVNNLAAKLEPGLYEVNDLVNKWNTSHYLLVDTYVFVK